MAITMHILNENDIDDTPTAPNLPVTDPYFPDDESDASPSSDTEILVFHLPAPDTTPVKNALAECKEILATFRDDMGAEDPDAVHPAMNNALPDAVAPPLGGVPIMQLLEVNLKLGRVGTSAIYMRERLLEVTFLMGPKVCRAILTRDEAANLRQALRIALNTP